MTRATALCVLLMGVFGLSGVACDDRKEGSPMSPSPNPPPPPPPALVSVALAGNANLAAVGETSQLTVTASYNDGSTKDVTREVRWFIGDSRVLSVSQDGLVTVVGLGRTYVTASYLNRGAGMRVTATPPGTFVISGRVREPGQGGVLDATITDRASGLSTTANSDGAFSLAALRVSDTRLGITKAEYEPRELDATTSSEVDAPIQRMVRVTAGDSIEPAPLAPNDLAYNVDGVSCDPCRMIRVAVPTTGDMQLVLTWDLPARLTLYAGGMSLTGDSGRAEGFMTISTPRELVVYVGASRLTGHTKFKLATTLP